MRERFPDELKGRVLASVQFRELRLSLDGPKRGSPRGCWSSPPPILHGKVKLPRRNLPDSALPSLQRSWVVWTRSSTSSTNATRIATLAEKRSLSTSPVTSAFPFSPPYAQLLTLHLQVLCPNLQGLPPFPHPRPRPRRSPANPRRVHLDSHSGVVPLASSHLADQRGARRRVRRFCAQDRDRLEQ